MKTHWTTLSYVCAVTIALSPFTMALVSVAPERAVAYSTTSSTRRVTFHNANPDPLTFALVAKYAGTEVVVQQQHFIRKTRIAEIVDGEWVFLEDKLRDTLLDLKPVYEDEWNWREPQFSTLMLDSEPIDELYGSKRIEVLQDALGLCHQILGQTVQVGFYANPSHKALPNTRPPVYFLDGVLAQQGAIFIICNFSNRGGKWFEKGMRQTQTLLDRIESIRGDRPVIGYVWPRRWPNAGFEIIPDDKLLEHLRLLNDHNVEISVADFDIDAEGVHLIELARSVVMEELAEE